MEQFYHLMILLGLCVLFKLGFLPYVDRGVSIIVTTFTKLRSQKTLIGPPRTMMKKG